MNLNLVNKKALVLSSSKGIGFAIAKALAREGCHVTITSSSKKNLIAGIFLNCMYFGKDLFISPTFNSNFFFTWFFDSESPKTDIKTFA